jgi:uracil-DNA glycosylase
VRRLPPSLVNIFTEYAEDLGYPAPASGDLSPWSERGVLLLNRVLTVAPGTPGSHRGKGWEAVTDQAIRALAGRQQPLVAILWGRDARTLAPLLDGVARAAVSSARVRSAGPISCSSSKAPSRSTGSCRSMPTSQLPERELSNTW